MKDIGDNLLVAIICVCLCVACTFGGSTTVTKYITTDGKVLDEKP